MEPEAAVSRFAGPLNQGHALLMLVTTAPAECTGWVVQCPLVGRKEGEDILLVHRGTGRQLASSEMVIKSLKPDLKPSRIDVLGHAPDIEISRAIDHVDLKLSEFLPWR